MLINYCIKVSACFCYNNLTTNSIYSHDYSVVKLLDDECRKKALCMGHICTSHNTIRSIANEEPEPKVFSLAFVDGSDSEQPQRFICPWCCGLYGQTNGRN